MNSSALFSKMKTLKKIGKNIKKKRSIFFNIIQVLYSVLLCSVDTAWIQVVKKLAPAHLIRKLSDIKKVKADLFNFRRLDT